jgi:hypothetical protein
VTAKDWTRFRDSVAAEVSEQYPQIADLDEVVERVIERRVELLGWEWTNDEPKHKQGRLI